MLASPNFANLQDSWIISLHYIKACQDDVKIFMDFGGFKYAGQPNRRVEETTKTEVPKNKLCRHYFQAVEFM